MNNALFSLWQRELNSYGGDDPNTELIVCLKEAVW